MSNWWWVAILVGGLILVIGLGAVRRRRVMDDAEPRREGFCSFVYYVLFDWWVDWL